MNEERSWGCEPFPEIVERSRHDTPYRIVDTANHPNMPSNGMTNKSKRELYVPLTPEGHTVSRHELAHVKWSPTRMPGLDQDQRVVLAVEDARINQGLQVVNLPMVLDDHELNEIADLVTADLRRGDKLMFALRAVASLGTNAVDTILQAPGATSGDRAVVRGMVDRVRRELASARRSGPVPAFRTVKRIAAEVESDLRRRGWLKGTGPKRPIACCCLGHTTPIDAEVDGVDPIPGGIARIDGSGAAGTMTIRTAPLEHVCQPRPGGRARRWRPSAEGSVIRWIHRYPLDGAIFRRPGRTCGGTVLIDTSGSMSLKPDDLGRIIAAAPMETTVAIYSGRGRLGELRIVARAGRRAGERHLKPYGSGNIVDEPALKWLSRQAEPRIWLSDGGVTGVGDRGSSVLRERCRSIRRRGRIRQVRTIDEAAGAMAG